MKILFIPLSVAASILGGILGRQVFKGLWAAIDKQDPPDPSVEETTWRKLIMAAAIQGAVFSGARAVTDHSARRAFRGLTGSWPGQQRPDPKN